MSRWLPCLFALILAGCVSPMPEPMPDQADVALQAGEDETAAPAEAAPATEDAAAPTLPAARQPRRRIAAMVPTPPPPKPDELLSQPMEEVVVTPGSLTGFWRLTASRMIDVEIGLFSGIHVRYGAEMRDRNICWLQQAGRRLGVWCSSGALMKSAEGSVGDDGVSMRWWSGPATITFSGKIAEADRINGAFSGGVVGLSVTGNLPATLTRLAPSQMQPDPDRPSAGVLREVWEDVRKGHLTDGRYEGSGVKRVNDGLSRELASDPPQGLDFLGQILIRWRKEQREFTEDVYQVKTAAGRDLCRIALNDGNQVADFNCVAMP
jgi:hypothetical protein